MNTKLPDSFREGLLSYPDYLIDSAAFLVDQRYGDTIESPIESLFLTALIFIDQTLSRLGIYIEPQSVIELSTGVVRVDFWLSYKAADCIVECDGRDYHHASWEQIERDRSRDAMIEQEIKLKVFRFPGTQIHNDPAQCAYIVLRYLKDLNDQRAEREAA